MQEKSKPVDNLRADAEKIITRAIAAVLPDAAEDAEAAVEADAAPPQAARPRAATPRPAAIRKLRREIFFIVKTSIFYLKPFDSPILMLIAQK